MPDAISDGRPALDEARAYLVDLYTEHPQGLLWIGGHADGWKGRTFTTVDAAAQYAVHLDGRGGQGVYHRSTTLAAVPAEGRGKADDSSHAYYFALDVDLKGPGHKADDLPENWEDANRLIERAGLPAPTAWVLSGGGWYPQWRFPEPIDVREPEQREWVTRTFSDLAAHCIEMARQLGWMLDNVRDLARVFRMPGTTNRKVAGQEEHCWVVGQEGEHHDLGVLAAVVRRARPVEKTRVSLPTGNNSEGEAPFDDARREFTRAQATEFVARARRHLATRTSELNAAINAFAMVCAHFPWLVDEDLCARLVIKSLGPSQGWTEPDANDRATIASAYRATAAGKSWVAAEVEGAPDAGQEGDSSRPRLRISGAADMAYWLAENAGKGRMAGFFLRRGQMVHTPRVGEEGYLPPPRSGDNGPIEIRPVTAPTLAAKLQYTYDCYKVDKEGKESSALFPVEAARRAVDAPESLGGLRVLEGVTGTPMVRTDGSLLDQPGYDEGSGFLFLPEPGVVTPARTTDVTAARKLLLGMVADFPFASMDDRANYLALLLTPLLRQVAPPSYKLFGIGAHQPGSGKSLLAEIAGIVHGAVLRSDVPEDEAEWRKQTFSILATTAAPVIVIDNVMGVLRSSVLAGVLTAGRDLTDRELGTSRTITVPNDRVWVVTGNNLSLGGDLVRRTVTVLIDPDRPNPEKRTDFRIPDLRSWVIENRNEVLGALMTLIRAWVVEGMPEPERAQSDSFARWSRVVAGILSVAGIPGEFDAESGRRAARGGDDDGLARLLDVLEGRFGGLSWSVAEALEPKAAEGWIGESRDWLPAPVIEKLARSEATGRQSFGHWLRNRAGRWVTLPDGRAMVIREAPMEQKVARWRIEVR